MTMTPKQWFQFHDRVLEVWRVFQAAPYFGDTGLWVVADSGGASDGSVNAEKLRVISAAHSPGLIQGNGNICDSNNKLKAMGRGSGLETDTGRAGGGS